MPEYIYECPNGHRFSTFTPMKDHRERLACWCATWASQIITAPLLVKAAADVRYHSPIDGTPITSWAARQEDLKRNNCVPYEPEAKQDYHRNIKESEAALDKAIDAHVEETVAKMPTKQRGKLFSELTEQGVTADVIRH